MGDAPTIDELLKADPVENVPVIPEIDTSDPDHASVEYSQHRTKLSTHRTALSIHRTALSTHRTELSTHRTELSTHRTELSTHRTALSERRTDLSGRRTGMSFHRTRMSAERTLMSVVRTSLSLISFGFTIYQFLGRLADEKLLTGGAHAPRNFGLALIYLGVGLLVIGIVYHIQFMIGLRRERDELGDQKLIHAASKFPVSYTLLAAVLLLLIGIVAAANLTFHVGPFG